MKVFKIIVTVVVVLLVILVGLKFLVGSERPIAFWDYPYQLQDQEQVIEVFYVRWACACPEWEIRTENPNGAQSDCDNCIFLESANDDFDLVQKVVDENNRAIIKLRGKFYKNKGVSRDYEQPTSEHPKHARVFRYVEYEVIAGS